MQFPGIEDLLDLLLPQNEDTRSLRRYHLRVALVACGAFVTAFTVATALVIGLPMVGRVAWINDVHAQVRNDVTAAVKPIQDELVSMNQKLVVSEVNQKRILVGQVSAQLMELRALQCALSRDHNMGDNAWQRMRIELEEANSEYHELTGEWYMLPACTEARF